MHDSPHQSRRLLRVLKHVSDPFPCSYLPGRDAVHEILVPLAACHDEFEPPSARRFPDPSLRASHSSDDAFVDSRIYFSLLNRNFRRAGRFFYRPHCTACRECRQFRILADDFRPDRSQRRVARLNADLHVSVGPPRLDHAAQELYQRYINARHPESPDSLPSGIHETLYDSCVSTLEFRYALADRLIMVALADHSHAPGPDSFLSAVYCFFDPDFPRRSLGTFNILTLIAQARARRLHFLYLGYFIRDCRKMNYKARFQPAQRLDEHDHWVPAPRFP